MIGILVRRREQAENEVLQLCLSHHMQIPVKFMSDIRATKLMIGFNDEFLMTQVERHIGKRLPILLTLTGNRI